MMDRRRFLKSASGLFVPALPALIIPKARAQGGMMPGPGTVHSTGGGSYTGPGDVQSGAVWWGGLRGYAAAYATGTNPAVDLADQAGGNPITINIKSDGTLDVAAIATWVAAHSVTTIRIATLYDQSGGGNNAVQAALANMPQLVLGPITGLASNRPTITFNGGSFIETGLISGADLAQPITMSAVAIRTSGTTAGGMIGGVGGGSNPELLFDTANNAGVYSGSAVVDAAQTDNAWHAFQGVTNGASSLVNVDGVDGSTGNSGSSGLTRSGTGHIVVGADTFGQAMVGNFGEAGTWNISFTTAAKSAAMSANQHSYWGF